MRTSLLSFVLLSGCFQQVDVGSEFNGLTTDGYQDGGVFVTRPDEENPPQQPDAGPCSGELFISSVQQWEDFESAGCVTWDGDLVIRGEPWEDLSTLTDNVLQTVTGQFRIVGTAKLTAATFQELKSARIVDIALNGKVETVDLPKLTSCSRLNLVFNQSMSALSLPELSSMGSADIRMNDKLTVLNLPSLGTVQGELTISNNAMLRQCVADGIFAALTPPRGPPPASTNGGTPNVCP